MSMFLQHSDMRSVTYRGVLAALDGEPQLLLDEMSQRGPAPTRDFVLVREDLGIASLRSGVRKEERLEVVVDGVSDEYTVFQKVRNFFLHFFEGSSCVDERRVRDVERLGVVHHREE